MKSFTKFLVGSFVLFSIITSSIYSQATTLHVFQEWTGRTGLISSSIIVGKVTLPVSGKQFVLGSTISATGDYDILLTCMGAGGQTLWSSQFDGGLNLNDYAADIVYDSYTGNLILTGAVTSDTSDGLDVGFAAFDTTGAMIWGNRYDNGQSYPLYNDVGTKITTDGGGYIYITGSSDNGALGVDFLTLQLDASTGTIQWSQLFDYNSANDYAGHIYYSSGNVFVTGFAQKAPFHGAPYVLEYDNSGTLVSQTPASSFVSDTIEQINDVCIDVLTRDIYIAGYINQSGTGKNAKVIKLDSSLNVVWEFTSSFTGDDEANAIELDNMGSFYVGGYKTIAPGNKDFLYAKLNTAGNLIWGPYDYNGGGGGNDVINSIAVDNQGNPIFAGYGKTAATNTYDYLTIKTDTASNILWEINYNGLANNDDYGNFVSVDTDGSIYVIGQSEDSSGTNKQFITVKYVEHELYNVPDSTNNSILEVIPNWGQILNDDTIVNINNDIKFYSSRPALYFKNNELTHIFLGVDTILTTEDTLVRIDVKFNNDTLSRVYPEKKRKIYSNFYYPHLHSTKGLTNVPNYEKIVYPNVYRLIDLYVGRNAKGIRKQFIVKPIGDADDIKLVYTGADTIYVDLEGKLHVETILDDLIYLRPGVSQIDSNGNNVSLSWQPIYKISGDTISFDSILTYNSNLPLVIEMNQGVGSFLGGGSGDNLEWSTYIGGSAGDRALEVTTDEYGNVIVCGQTNSYDFPTGPGISTQDSLSGNYDLFVVKFDLDAEKLWGTYYGGTNEEYPYSILNSSGDGIYIVGHTKSSNFPTIPFASNYYQDYFGGGIFDGFILEIRPSGLAYWATYFGGGTYDQIWDIKIDDSKNLYCCGLVTGKTISAPFVNFAPGHPLCSVPTINHGFPLCNTIGAVHYDTIHSENSGLADAFIAKFDENKHLVWSTLYGGNGNEYATTLEVDQSSNSFYIGGMTNANIDGNNSIVSPCPMPTNGGFPYCDLGGSTFFLKKNINPFNYSPYIMQFSSDGDLLWSSLIAPYSEDGWVTDIDINSGGDIYISSFIRTQSNYDLPNIYCDVPTNGGFPLCYPIGYQYSQNNDNLDNGYDAYLVKFNVNKLLQWATLFGGSGNENSTFLGAEGNLAIDEFDRVYFVGTTQRQDTIPLVTQSYPNYYYVGTNTGAMTSTDAFVACFDKYNVLRWCTMMAGDSGLTNKFDYGLGIALDNINQKLYMVGATNSLTFPFVDPMTTNPYLDSVKTGSQDAYISRFRLDSPPIGIEEIEPLSLLLDLYPNPTKDFANLRFSKVLGERARIKAFDLLGNLIFISEIDNVYTGYIQKIDLTLLPNSIYMIQVEMDEGTKTFKLVKN